MNNEYKMPIGCAFTVNDLFYNINSKNIKVSNKVKIKYTSNRPTYKEFAGAIFRLMIKIIVKDLVETGATLKLPLRGAAKAFIKVDRYEGDEFKKLRKAGHWKDLNFFESMFSGPILTLHMQLNGIDRKRAIICDRATNKEMIDKCNNGFQYGDKNIDKTTKDYYEVMYNTFPDIPKETIETILNYGWRILYIYRSYGAEVSCRVNDFSCYFGRIYKNRSKLLKHYSIALSIKLRLTALREGFPVTDLHYFALGEKDYLQFLKSGVVSLPVVVYQLFEECLVSEYRKSYIFSTYMPEVKTYRKYLRNGLTNKANLILTRKSMKFKDMCTLENDYMILEYKGNRKRHPRQNLNEFTNI